MASRVLSRAAGRLRSAASAAATTSRVGGAPAPVLGNGATLEHNGEAGARRGDMGSRGNKSATSKFSAVSGDEICSVGWGWRATVAGAKEGPFPAAEVLATARRAAAGSGVAAVFVVDDLVATSAGRAAVSALSSRVEVFLLAGDDQSAAANFVPLAGDDRSAALELFLLAGGEKRVDLAVAGWTAIAAVDTKETLFTAAVDIKKAPFPAAERVGDGFSGGKPTVRARAYWDAVSGSGDTLEEIYSDTILASDVHQEKKVSDNAGGSRELVAASMGACGRVRPSANVDGLRLFPFWFSADGDVICSERLKGGATNGFVSAGVLGAKGAMGGIPPARSRSYSRELEAYSSDDVGSKETSCCHASQHFAHAERESERRNTLDEMLEAQQLRSLLGDCIFTVEEVKPMGYMGYAQAVAAARLPGAAFSLAGRFCTGAAHLVLLRRGFATAANDAVGGKPGGKAVKENRVGGGKNTGGSGNNGGGRRRIPRKKLTLASEVMHIRKLQLANRKDIKLMKVLVFWLPVTVLALTLCVNYVLGITAYVVLSSFLNKVLVEGVRVVEELKEQLEAAGVDDKTVKLAVDHTINRMIEIITGIAKKYAWEHYIEPLKIWKKNFKKG